MFKVAYYEAKKMLRDYRLLIIFVFQPIILIFLLGNTAAHNPKDVNVALFNRYDNAVSSQIMHALRKSPDIKITEFKSEDEVKEELNDNKSKLGVLLSVDPTVLKANKITFIRNTTVPEISSVAETVVSKTVSAILGENIKITTELNTSQKINYFSYFASAIMVLILVLIGLNASVTAITQERVDGTFERFFVTPYSKATLVFGKMFSYIGISLVLTLTIIVSMKFMFDVALGPLWLVALLTFANGLAAIALGLLISSFTYTIDESIQVGSLFFFALLILTGLIFQPETMHPVIAKAYYAMPFTYAMIGMREVNILGFGLSQIYKDIIILLGSAVIFLFAAILTLRRKAR